MSAVSANPLSAIHATRCFAGIAALHNAATIVAWHFVVDVKISSNAMVVGTDAALIAGRFLHVNVATKPGAMIVPFISLVSVAILCLIVASVLTLTTSSGAIFARSPTATTVGYKFTKRGILTVQAVAVCCYRESCKRKNLYASNSLRLKMVRLYIYQKKTSS